MVGVLYAEQDSKLKQLVPFKQALADDSFEKLDAGEVYKVLDKC